ncbi:hypothetical protein SNEBB_006227 [Seison nebaliae]|nr:hypothetical protein SNEBB_006227 [Seison nebaliae]
MQKVHVYVRPRPTEQTASFIEFEKDERTIKIHTKHSAGYSSAVNNVMKDWSLRVDGVLLNAGQEKVYDDVVRDVVNKGLDGYNGTILCYGQTGTGKTYTMTGATENYRNRGLIPRSLQHIYKEIDKRINNTYTIRVSYLEIYNEQMYDLLATLQMSEQMDVLYPGNNMQVVEFNNRVYVKGLTSKHSQTEEDALNCLFEGETNRAIGSHVLNKVSSRSHCIFTIHIEAKNNMSSSEKITISKLNFVDLAGSERLSKTMSEGVTQKEAMYINKSLCFLEQVVMSLTDKSKAPNLSAFRSSKLTHYLKDSIGGNCFTVMVANIMAEDKHMEETISTLRFSSGMMSIPMSPLVNEAVDSQRMLEKLEKEVKDLREELSMHDVLANQSARKYEPINDQQMLHIENKVCRYVEGSLMDLDIVNIRQIKATFQAFKKLCLSRPGLSTDNIISSKDEDSLMTKDKTEVDEGKFVSKDVVKNQVGHLDPGSGYGIGKAPNETHGNKDDLSKLKGMKSSQEPMIDMEPMFATEKVLRPPKPRELPPEKRDGTPPKEIAFDEFKQGPGIEINRILTENKDILAEKKQLFADCARQINSTKQKIDEARIDVDNKRTERVELGDFTNERGETIIDEEEYRMIKRLQQLKSEYRESYEKWRTLRSEISYCHAAVDKCRQRLVSEFEQWYNEIYSRKDSGNTETKNRNYQRLPGNTVRGDEAAYKTVAAKTNRRHLNDPPISQSNGKPRMNRQLVGKL